MEYELKVGMPAPGLGQIIDLKTPVKDDPSKKLVLIALAGRPEGSHQFMICEWRFPSDEPGWVITSGYTLEAIFKKWQEM